MLMLPIENFRLRSKRARPDESGRIDPHYAEAALVELEQQLST
jgi:hypothetical protein